MKKDIEISVLDFRYIWDKGQIEIDLEFRLGSFQRKTKSIIVTSLFSDNKKK